MSTITSPSQDARKAWLSTLATAPTDALLNLWDSWCTQHGQPAHQVLRAPEIGTVMVRGRAGGTGAPFNLGEITVTRCSVRLASGEVGHGYVQGRSKPACLAAALIDALSQSDGSALDQAILQPLRDQANAKADTRAAKAAATKVDFFTMVRGDN